MFHTADPEQSLCGLVSCMQASSVADALSLCCCCSQCCTGAAQETHKHTMQKPTDDI